MPTVHLLIQGKVQGVFYRASARDVAEELKLTGWVRNTKEGHVEALVTGNNEKLQRFINWCKKGPSDAVVTEVQVTEKKEENFERFRVIKGMD
jgi:acylphosphatase